MQKQKNRVFLNLNVSQNFSRLPAQCATTLYDIGIVAIFRLQKLENL